MPNLLQRGAEYLAAQLQAHASQPVTYRRGTGEEAVEVAIDATIGRSEFELTTDDGIVERVETRDFLFPTADLVLAETATVPQRGDKIIETIGDATLTYEVLPHQNLPAFRYSDEFRVMLRVHTKLINTA